MISPRASLFALLLLLALLVAPAASAQEAQRPAPPRGSEATRLEAIRPPADSTTRHAIAVAGERLAYVATAGTIALGDDTGETTAQVFYTAYRVEPAAGVVRPITFVFNGGPGAASAFLHIGALGPRVVPFNEKGGAAQQPPHLVDNPDTWLTFTDLVFVDPVSTGYSRAVGGEAKARTRFHGIDKDADAMLAFIQTFLARSARTLDPILVAGESYGGFRAILLTRRLLRAGLDVRGTILVSPAIEFSLLRSGELALLPTALALPSLAASHHELATGRPPEEALQREVEVFARGPYLTHLAAGRRANAAVEADLARYTGLPIEAIARLHGRITVREFVRDWRLRTNSVLSLYDGTVSTPVSRPAGERHADPILDHAAAVLAPAFVNYVRTELGFISDARYHLLNREVASHWDFGTSPQRQGFAGALDELQEARTQRPRLRVFIASGLTDLVTPYAVSQYLVDQLRPLDGAAPVSLKVYPGGHMMYFRATSRAALTRDVRAIYGEAMQSW